ncbi:hypothetical protein [Aquipuribacter nitratireducens]|uniref:Uncharacterized protein n=1 Tax=Aquipuribacter nitratireducens TaxID=650104 RepID=A0ABW0GQ46_9MICO
MRTTDTSTTPPAPTVRYLDRPRARGRYARTDRAEQAHRRRTSLVAWCLALALPAAAAAALWSVGGSGPGQGRATTAQDLVVTAGTASSQLYPGGAGDVVFDVANPNPFPVTVTGANLGTVTGVAACSAANFTTGAGTVTPVSIAANASATVTVVGGLQMLTSAGDGCQGVTVTVDGTLVAAQS